jgi:hypothetical protein
MAKDLRGAVAGRPGWHVEDQGDAATYMPGGEWDALVRRVWNPGGRRVGEAWHVALRRDGVAQQTRIASTPDQAVKFAERLADG